MLAGCDRSNALRGETEITQILPQMGDRKEPCLIHFQNWFYCLRQQLQTKTKGENIQFTNVAKMHWRWP